MLAGPKLLKMNSAKYNVMWAYIELFNTMVIAGSALGLGCLAAALYFESLKSRNTRKKEDSEKHIEDGRIAG